MDVTSYDFTFYRYTVKDTNISMDFIFRIDAARNVLLENLAGLEIIAGSRATIDFFFEIRIA